MFCLLCSLYYLFLIIGAGTVLEVEICIELEVASLLRIQGTQQNFLWVFWRPDNLLLRNQLRQGCQKALLSPLH